MVEGKKDNWSLDIFLSTFRMNSFFNYLNNIGKAPNTIEHSVNYINEVSFFLIYF